MKIQECPPRQLNQVRSPFSSLMTGEVFTLLKCPAVTEDTYLMKLGENSILDLHNYSIYSLGELEITSTRLCERHDAVLKVTKVMH